MYSPKAMAKYKMIMLLSIIISLISTIGLILAYCNLVRLQRQIFKQNAFMERLTSENASIIHEIQRLQQQIEQRERAPTHHTQ
jgi:cell division protein FtsB